MRKINEQWVKKTPFYKFTYDSSVNNSFEKKKVIIYIKVFEQMIFGKNVSKNKLGKQTYSQ